jgi:trehalose 6-phosphate phosphatase
MNYLFSKDSLSVLPNLAKKTTLCAFDFDGTLAPIVSHPDLAGLMPDTHTLLSQLANLYPCIVISGRAREDVSSRLHNVSLQAIIGNHGAETGAGTDPDTLIESWKISLSAGLSSTPGIWIENKGFSLAVHYRASLQKKEARARILHIAQSLPHVCIFGGKLVVNLAPNNAPNKGSALIAERARLHCNWVLYVGDDENDETAFSIGGNIVSVRIGRRKQSTARFYLREQSEIDTLLKSLIAPRLPAQTML